MQTALSLPVLSIPFLTFVTAMTATAADLAAAEPTAISHAVFFTLKDDSDAAKQELVGLCEKYLTEHEGTVYFSAGVRGTEFNREVNDQSFDVALLVVFKDKAAHDKYQDHPRHLEFIKQGKANWEKVRVFDSYVKAP